MNKFFTHITFNIAILSLLIGIKTQCMLDKESTSFPICQDTMFINLNNPIAVKKALIDSANNLVHAESQSNMFAGLRLFRDIVCAKEGYQEAEAACINCFSKKYLDQEVTIAILDLLEVLNNDNQAIDTALIVATEALTDHRNKVKKSAILILHELIVVKDINPIPQKTIEATMPELNHTDSTIKSAAGNIMHLILGKLQSANSSDSELHSHEIEKI